MRPTRSAAEYPLRREYEPFTEAESLESQETVL